MERIWRFSDVAASFRNLRFRAWDESHSSTRLCANSMIDDDEILTTDRLLVTGKKPQSLAKFLSNSLVFKQKMKDARMLDETVSFVKNWMGPPSGSQAERDRMSVRLGGGRASLPPWPQRLNPPTRSGVDLLRRIS